MQRRRENQVASVQSEGVRQVDAVLRSLKLLRKGLVQVRDLYAAQEPIVAATENALNKMNAMENKEALASVVPMAYREEAEYRERLEHLKRQRSDVTKRREEMVRLARQNGMEVLCTGTADFTGPFKIEHQEDQSTVFFGKSRLERIPYPAAIHLVKALEKWRKSLEEKARKGWEEFIVKAVNAQEEISSSEAVPWRRVLNSVIPNEKSQKRLGVVLRYRLSMLISGRGPGGWRVVIVPPPLAEQRQAWSVPRMDRPNELVRVARLRLVRQTESSHSLSS